jgi:predicted nucleotidyltransferase
VKEIEMENEAIRRRVAALRSLFEADSRIVGVFLFGSQAEDSATPHSDVDLGILFEGFEGG